MRWVLLFPSILVAQIPEAVQSYLDWPLLDPKQSQMEVQVHTASRVPPAPVFSNAVTWQGYASDLRRQVLENVVFRGRAAEWRKARVKVEWVDTITGQGYRLRKFRYEAVPGMWIPALLYEPERREGKAPVVLNVNGHERTGVSTPYIQTRCINLARRGMLAFNAEWMGRGQLTLDRFSHYRMPQIDLTGTSGLAVFYLAMERLLDIALSHENADPARVAVTGLSGGGWQTTIISALDERVKLAVPVAGHSSYVTRAQWPELDLGDSEQTPSDLASIADYTHLSAMMAPRPLLLINNAKDNCCFRADYALAPLVQAARGVYALHGAQDKLRYSINHGAGHNYDQSSREELYRFLGEHFFAGRADYPLNETPAESEIRTAEQLHVPVPPENETFHSLALKLSRNLPRPGGTRERLKELVRAVRYTLRAEQVKRERADDVEVTGWRLRMDDAWTVPAIELKPRSAKTTVLLLGDDGRRALASEAARRLGEGLRVIAVDPFYFGESKIATRDFLFALLLAGIGERPLGVQASQLAALARWAGGAEIAAFGPRTSLIARVAAAIEPDSIRGVQDHNAFASLKEILARDLTADKMPELFCFGLLEHFDVPRIRALGK
jgi:dienelactone hydrolase